MSEFLKHSYDSSQEASGGRISLPNRKKTRSSQEFVLWSSMPSMALSVLLQQLISIEIAKDKMINSYTFVQDFGIFISKTLPEKTENTRNLQKLSLNHSYTTGPLF
jgi:hypothetical protein